MAVKHAASFPQNPVIEVAQILNADSTGLKTLRTGSADGDKVSGVLVTSTDIADRTVQIGIEKSGTFYTLGTVPILAGAGSTATVATVNLWDHLPLPKDNDGEPYLFLTDANYLLRARMLVAVASGKQLDFVVILGKF